MEWSVSDASVASVDDTGRVTALTAGRAVVTARAGEKSAECDVTVDDRADEVYIGDFYYSDGSWSEEPDPSKTPIGVVFWVGDPTGSDAALRREHPGCTHGLVVSLDVESRERNWQSGYANYRSTVGEWIEAHAPQYISVTSPHGEDDRLNAVLGYNNTKAIEAFNADPANAAWPVEVVQQVVAYRQEVPAPPSSSDWFVPSVKELSLLICGEWEGNVLDIDNNLDNLAMMNYKLGMLPHAETIGSPDYDYDYWASTERDAEYAFYISTLRGKVWMGWKDYDDEFHLLRYVLAF